VFIQPIHLHKTLGVLCLLSFVWRLTQVNETDMGFYTRPHLTIPTLILHLLLSTTSFIFRIPNRRIKEGSRIWPEYRYHSMVFVCRSILALLLYWYEQHTNAAKPFYIASVIIVLLTMLAADAATFSQEQYASNSIRQLDISRMTSYFFSVCQFYATAGVLFGVRRYTIQFLMVFVVQLNPFLMTLRRKNLISHYATVSIYGFMLVFGSVICIYEYTRYGIAMLRTVAFVGNVAVVWRTSLIPLKGRLRTIVQNKYLIWTALGILVQYIRPYALMQEISMQRNMVYTSSMVAVVVNGYVKCNSNDYSFGTTNDSSVNGTNVDSNQQTERVKKID
jgi:hypothetical protein